MSRTYDNTRRAARAARTADRIVDSAEALLGRRVPGEVTLQAIADGAGVTVQTVLRHHGSRDGCIAAVRDRVVARIDVQRGHTPPGDVDAALDDLVDHYEAEGRLVLHLLHHEDSGDAFTRQAVTAGRAYHRDWVTRTLAAGLAPADRVTVDALVAATDLYVWKLLRLDLGRSRTATRAALARMVRAILEAP